MAAIAVIGAGGFWLLNHYGLLQAQIETGKWKNFSENEYNFSIDYPANWSLDVNYGQYAKGILSADLSNKKCQKGQCDSDCVDARVLVARKPAGTGAQALILQLYENFMMVRDFSESPQVSALDLGAKKVFKVIDEQPTLALNGRCAGPFYVFETEKQFVYVFAGYGAGAADLSGDVEKIIESIEID